MDGEAFDDRRRIRQSRPAFRRQHAHRRKAELGDGSEECKSPVPSITISALENVSRNRLFGAALLFHRHCLIAQAQFRDREHVRLKADQFPLAGQAEATVGAGVAHWDRQAR